MDDNPTALDESQAITDEVARRVAAEIARRGLYKNQVAQAADIPQSTFSRKLHGLTDFTIPELARTAAAIGCDWTLFLPLPEREALSA